MADDALVFEGVGRTYGRDVEVHALTEVDLTVRTAELTAIVGPSGSGKSTMLGLLGLLDRPTSGRVVVEGADAARLSDRSRTRLRAEQLGFVFQQFHLIPHLDAEANVETALLGRGLKRKNRLARSRLALERVGLAHRADHLPTQLSGGEQQRVAIARAIVADPRIVLADEPTGALDTVNAAAVMDILRSLVAEDRALVIVTHDAEIAGSADRRVSLRDGRVVEDIER